MFIITISESAMYQIIASGMNWTLVRIDDSEQKILDYGGFMEVQDRFGEGKTGYISRDTLQAGLVHLQKTCPRVVAALVGGTYDGPQADMLLQAAALGDVIYG